MHNTFLNLFKSTEKGEFWPYPKFLVDVSVIREKDVYYMTIMYCKYIYLTCLKTFYLRFFVMSTQYDRLQYRYEQCTVLMTELNLVLQQFYKKKNSKWKQLFNTIMEFYID